MTREVFLAVVVIAVVVAAIGGYLVIKGLESDSQNPATSPDSGNAKAREINVIAKQWEFQPSEIRVKAGEKVRLKIKSIDVAHGISIPDFGIDEYLEPGKETVVEFTATKPGRFPFFCSVYCGQGHGNMKGVLVVEE